MATTSIYPPDDKAEETNEENEGEFKGKLLHTSCLWANVDLLGDLLMGNELKNINSQDSKGRTALHAAVISNSLKCARLLLMNEADPNIQQFDGNMSGKSCLHIAAERGQEDMAQILIKFNANIYAKDGNGFTAMDLAEQAQHQKVVDLLKSSIVERDKMRSDLYESLAIAVHKGDVATVKSLLVKAKAFSSCEFESNPLQLSHQQEASLVNFAPNGSNTLLFKACQEGHLEIVAMLIAAGSDGRQHPVTKYSPLYISAYHGRLQICELLLKHFPEMAAIYTVEHWLPVHAAAMNNHQDIVKLLLSYAYPSQVRRCFVCRCEATDASPTLASSSLVSRQSSFSRAAHHAKGDPKETSRQYYIYLMPFDVNAQDIAGQSLLYLATLLGNQSLVEFLLNYRSKAISYADYCGKETPNEADSQMDTFEIVDSDGQLECIFNEDDEFDLSLSEDDDSNSSSSSQDITVISSFDSKSSSQNRSDPSSSASPSSVSPIQRLIEKLSPSSFPSKPVHSIENDTKPIPKGSNTKKLKQGKRYYFSNPKPKPPTYCINPVLIDLYCNYNMETALHCAVKKRHYSIASLLLEHGGEANAPINGQLMNPSIITRISHFNHNFFLPPLSISNSLRDLHNLASGEAVDNRHNSSNSPVISSSDGGSAKGEKSIEGPRYRSTALREAIRNRDKAMVDLLFRFGARDNLEKDYLEEDAICEDQLPSAMNALAIAFTNNDQHFVSKLLTLKAFEDCEFKINKRAFDIVGSNCMNALNRFNMINNVTVSSMFPSKAVMIDWHQLGLKSLESGLQRHLIQWLVDSSLVYNVKLKLCQVQEMSSTWNTALAAITRIDLSGNDINHLPLQIFTDLPSLKILNLSNNRLQTLPEIEANQKMDSFDDDSVVSLRRNSGQLNSSNISSSPSKASKGFFSRMRKSQSVTAALSSSPGQNRLRDCNKRSNYSKNRLSTEENCWRLPVLEEVYLQDNQIECVPSSLFQQPELRLVDLSNNKLRTLPPLFWFASKMTELNLSLNLFSGLPSPSQCSLALDLTSSYESLSIASNDILTNSDSSSSECKGIPKSISTSSICGNVGKSASRNSLERPFNESTASRVFESEQVMSTNLTPFELNVPKPWLARVNILNETFPSSIHEDTRLSRVNPSVESANSTGISLSARSQVPSQALSSSLRILNLSHNGFSTVPFLLSCLATRLTHLNLSYNQLSAVFDSKYLLGHYPVSLKHLDLSHNLIEDWILPGDTLEFEESSSSQSSHCCCHASGSSQPGFHKFVDSKGCPYKQHTRLDNLKTLILTKNYLKKIVITRDELTDTFAFVNGSQKSTNVGLSSSYNEYKFAARFSDSKQALNTSGSMDDLLALSQSSDINLNTKASRYTRLFFPNLSMLDVANNQLAEVPKTISYLSQLSVLNLSGNLELTRLPPEMGLLTKLWNLNTRGCLNLSEPLRSMIISKTYKTADIISYLNSILENSKLYTRMKLMIVGVQGIGKTSLLEQLRHEGTGRRTRTPDHWGKRMGNKSMGMKTPRGVTLSTVGVDLSTFTYHRKPLRGGASRDRSLSRTRMGTFQAAPQIGSLESDNIGPITFRTWDFGGQREYYATHQYFLSKRSIYLVVWKITDGEKGVDGLHPWLLNIQSRAPNSPVIICGTHHDLIKEYYPPFFSSDLQNMICDRYMSDAVDADKRGLPRVVASIEVSAKTRYNIRLLANLIYEAAYEMRTPGNKERLLEQKVPATYLALEEVVSFLAQEQRAASLEPVLHAEQYRADVVRALKERHNLVFRDFSELQQATRFLHENGVILHYEDANLKDLYFLDPQWLCDILAHVVTIREINPFAKNGIMRTEHLFQLFKNTHTAPPDVQNYLISLMNKFELGLTWDNRTLLIPSLLPTEEQLKAGHPGSDILIPLRSRMKLRRTSVNDSESTTIELKNQLHFQELNPRKSGPDPVSLIPKPICTATALARHSESIHRMLLLSYVPCGFWSRLITRMIADEAVIEIVRSFYHVPSSAQNDLALITLLNSANAKWHCWQTGFGLCYLDTFLLRVKEVSLTNLNTANTTGSAKFPSVTLLPTKSYPYDYQRIKFYLSQQVDSSLKSGTEHVANELRKSTWSEMYIAPQGSALIEIYLPNQTLHVETYSQEVAEEGSEATNQPQSTKLYILQPNSEMLTKLLVILVEAIDTLLEDYYPSLGTRFIHTSDGRFLITRLVPCTLCMRSFVEEAGHPACLASHTRNAPEGSTEMILSPLSPDTAEVDSNLVDFYKSEVKKATRQASQTETKQEFHDSAISTLNTETSAITESPEKPSMSMSMFHSVYAFMVEECILAVYEDRRLECPTHGRLRMDKIAPDIMFSDLKETFCIEREQLRFGKLLGRGSFGWVFRAFYTPKKSTHLSWKADTDSPTSNFTKRLVANSKFYLSSSSVEQGMPFENFEVAIKLLQPIRMDQFSSGIRKADLEAYSAIQSKWERDPLQYACKAYCTARTELNILATLKHLNIASIIGMCPKPLALVLTLAPEGSLDTHTKAYRRSGVRIASHILQQAFLQISKALEYLHQHHIIYRDLKSENVLVWSFPSALSNMAAQVHLKLADYGISRSSLPTGTKGFAGTEGYMAPEIMLHNGEEEYTEKVDCFSFAMFMYELCTLRFPFEGQEFAIRESILDGIRPALSQRDLQCLPESFTDLMVRCWAQEPSERPTISQVVSIISAPEFCSLLDVTCFPDKYALICATGFEKELTNQEASENSAPKNGINFKVCFSKVGKEVAFVEGATNKWNKLGYKLTCPNLANRTITCTGVVNGQLWLGDSQARIHMYSIGDHFDPICRVQLDFENAATLTAIKSMCWLVKANLVAICSNNGRLWLLSLDTLNKTICSSSAWTCFTSSELEMKEISSNGSMVLCMAHVDKCQVVESPEKKSSRTEHCVEIWCGQPEGKIAIVQVRPEDLFSSNQIVIDHYDDHFVRQSLHAIYIGSNVPLAERNDVFTLVASSTEPYIWSVLYTGFIIYQWDVYKRQLLHRLDCSKLAPCSESLMSISIEDHLKPGSCQVTAIACNEDNGELYVGTNSGCIIVAESHSLKPVTVFRPFNHEVKFIITFPDYTQMSNEEIDIEEVKLSFEEKHSVGRNALKSLHHVWPFSKRSAGKGKENAQVTKGHSPMHSSTIGDPKKRRPFVTIGRGYRNLLDRFIYKSTETRHDSLGRQLAKFKDTTILYGIIWDSGNWNVE